MKTTQIRELSADEMSARIAELQEERFRLKFRGATEALNGDEGADDAGQCQEEGAGGEGCTAGPQGGEITNG
jgi:hypothetical protein